MGCPREGHRPGWPLAPRAAAARGPRPLSPRTELPRSGAVMTQTTAKVSLARLSMIRKLWLNV